MAYVDARVVYDRLDLVCRERWWPRFGPLPRALVPDGADRPSFSFEGGLVDKATGRDLPDAQTGLARMRAGQAKQIDWSDDDALMNIDWSSCQVVCHPALKQD